MVPRGCLLSAGASPEYREVRNPKARAAGKEAVGPELAAGKECWQRTSLGTALGPVQNFRPWPGSYGPSAKPLPLSQVSFRVWPGLEVTWMLDLGPGAQLPCPLPGPRASSRVDKPSPGDAPSCPPRAAAVAGTVAASGPESPTWTSA